MLRSRYLMEERCTCNFANFSENLSWKTFRQVRCIEPLTCLLSCAFTFVYPLVILSVMIHPYQRVIAKLRVHEYFHD